PVFSPPDISVAESRALRGDLIKVSQRNGVVAGVKAIRRLIDFDDIDVRWQAVVDGVEDLLRAGNVLRPASARREFQVGDLRQRVDSGVRAPRAPDLDLAVEEILGGLMQFSGHGAPVRLLLPAAVTRAVVFEREFPGFHMKWVVGSG